MYDEDSTTHDWVELYNSGTEPINLVDFFLSDELDSLNKWQFPEGTLDPDSHLLVFASNTSVPASPMFSLTTSTPFK